MLFADEGRQVIFEVRQGLLLQSGDGLNQQLFGDGKKQRGYFNGTLILAVEYDDKHCAIVA